MKSIRKHWVLVNKKTGDFYAVQGKVQIFNARQKARFTSYYVDDHKVDKVIVTVERISH